AVAHAASKALPPFSNIDMPTAVAIQWVEVTTPNVPSISGRVVKGLGLILLMNSESGVWAAWRGVSISYRCGRDAATANDRIGTQPGAGDPLRNVGSLMQSETFALIVGGGPVGLAAAIELSWRGVPAILVTENLETSRHPKCNNTNARSMEHFRR